MTVKNKKWMAITGVSIAVLAAAIFGISSLPTASAGSNPLDCDGGEGNIIHYNKILWHSDKRIKTQFLNFQPGEPFETIINQGFSPPTLIPIRFQLEEILAASSITRVLNDNPIKVTHIIIDDVELSTICFNTPDTP